MANVSRPDICARLAGNAPRISALRGCDMYRINDLVKSANQWQPATELKYASSAQLGQESLATRDENARHRRAKIHGNATTLVGWADAAFGDQSSLGNADWDMLSV